MVVNVVEKGSSSHYLVPAAFLSSASMFSSIDRSSRNKCVSSENGLKAEQVNSSLEPCGQELVVSQSLTSLFVVFKKGCCWVPEIICFI